MWDRKADRAEKYLKKKRKVAPLPAKQTAKKAKRKEQTQCNYEEIGDA
jgi:hypothetical protein